MRTIEQIRQALNSFDRDERRAAVEELSRARAAGKWKPKPPGDWMNLHGHTFHSYNSEGWSPSRLVFEGVEAGLEIIGSVDFDVLDAMEEVLDAGDLLGIKTTVGLETRVFIPEYSHWELNSPGEPGVAYFMATGCYRMPEEGSKGHGILANLKDLAQKRNREMVRRINDHLDKVSLDFESDVLPMTPSENPTERHLVEAYNKKGNEVFDGDPAGLLNFWADRFAIAPDELEPILHKTNPFQELLRSKLMKKGGAGYAEPDPSSFPTLLEMVDLARDMGALPTYAFLDGTTPGESNMLELLEFFQGKGVSALNIIPDRNWNITDPDTKSKKVAKLYEAVDAASELFYPLCIGTEMNKAGLPFVDDFGATELEPVVNDFRLGGRALWGHTLLARTQDRGWGSDFATQYFADSQATRLEYYAKVGTEFRAGVETVEELRDSSQSIPFMS